MKKLTLLFLVAVISFSCTKDENNYGQYKKETPSSSSEESDASTKSIDILVPEVSLPDEIESEIEQDLLTLLDTFFSSFVKVVSQSPYDTRVRFEELNRLRTEKDRNFLLLVSLIERKITQTQIKDMSEEEKKAFYLNVYNYTAIRLINKGYIGEDGPIRSIRDLSVRFFPTEIFRRQTVSLSDGVSSLDDIAEKRLRELFIKEEPMESDPRYHLAINGAIMGRGLILDKAFRPEKLDQQLNFITQKSINLLRMAEIKNNRLYLSKVFEWAEDDFKLRYESMEKFFENYGIPASRYNRIRHKDFDWNLLDLSLYLGQTAQLEPEPLPDFEPQTPPILNQEPCGFLESSSVEVIGHCNQVVKGRINSFLIKYPVTVESASLCLYRRKLSNDEYTLGAIGDITERDDEDNLEPVTITTEGELTEENGQLTMRIRDQIISTLEYTLGTKRLMVRQNKIIPGGFLRKFSLQCE